MEEPIRIPKGETSANWAFTAFCGSFIMLLLAIFSEGLKPGLLLIYWFLSWLGAMLTGIPALVFLVILKNKLNKRNLPLKTYRKRHFLFQLLITILTFGILIPMAQPGNLLAALIMAAIGMGYMLIGMCLWWRSFNRIGRGEPRWQDLLDDDDE